MSLVNDDSGIRYITKEKAENMITQAFITYEKDVGSPRHMANFAMLQKINGGVSVLKWLGGAVVAIAGLYLAYLQVKR